MFTVASLKSLYFCNFGHFLRNIAQMDLLCLIILYCSCKHTYAQHQTFYFESIFRSCEKAGGGGYKSNYSNINKSSKKSATLMSYWNWLIFSFLLSFVITFTSGLCRRRTDRLVRQWCPFSNSPPWNFRSNFPSIFWWNFSNRKWIIYETLLKIFFYVERANQ